MADYTENYNLKKPDDTNFYNIQDFNGNADIIDAALNDKLEKDFSNISSGAIPIANGGTGATTAAQALSNLGVTTTLNNKADKDLSNVTGTLPVANGGTGATTVADALSNLGITTALDNKLNKDFSNASGGVIPITSGGTGNSAGYIRTGQKENTSVGNYATCEGYNTTASGLYSHAEGSSTTSSGENAHAEGWNTIASNNDSHAEGTSTVASGTSSHAEGESTTASGNYAHAEGYNTTASGTYSHAEGYKTTASGNHSHAEGNNTTTNGNYSHAAGYNTTSNVYQTVVGRYNVANGAQSSYTAGSGYFIVGSGTDSSAKANCFRATESNTYGKTYNTSGADYAEMFEWLDKNQLNEDRAGKFVTLDGDKIRLANEKDTYILGVVSGNASVIGDSYADQWAYMYEQDIFGRPIYETVTIPEERDENGDLIVEEHTEEQLKVSSKYDNTKKYIPRNERPEWAAIGLLGKLVCLDDGTAKVNDYVKPNKNAVATVSETQTKYRVMRRIDGSHIQIMIL